ncbi:hypothetical protein I79_004481 [Cricetulus griseus]|uniref:Uncharacterized protein n=1 Tax=Cricetulus griseus TaxID=10029 RepID=G3H2R0_CRIGR|nr:hypothetical protein I79_004481 [Cricetulus griseus]
MHRVPHIHQRWSGDEDDLQNPEADVRDGKGLIVADILATWLLGVAYEIRLLITPHKLGRGAKDEDAENEKDCEPNSANDGGVLIHLLQDVSQETPVTHCSPPRKQKAKPKWL